MSYWKHTHLGFGGVPSSQSHLSYAASPFLQRLGGIPTSGVQGLVPHATGSPALQIRPCFGSKQAHTWSLAYGHETLAVGTQVEPGTGEHCQKF